MSAFRNIELLDWDIRKPNINVSKQKEMQRIVMVGMIAIDDGAQLVKVIRLTVWK